MSAINSATADASTPEYSSDYLKDTLTSKLEATHVEVQDLSGGCGSAFHAVIVSPQFISKGSLARHRLVNTALKEELKIIHAWTMKCYTPPEWEKFQATQG